MNNWPDKFELQTFRLHEEGSNGWVGMSLFGVCGDGHDRQSAWDNLRGQLWSRKVLVELPMKVVN